MENQLSFNSEHRLRSENLSWDIDVWYPLVSEYTFQTIFIPLTRSEAYAIKAYHDISWRKIQKSFTKNEILILKNLEININNTIQSYFKHGAFVRLCGRSPKDGEPLHREHVLPEYESHLESLVKSGMELSSTTKMMAIARTSWLKVHSGAAVMSLLLTSERVYADIIDWLRFGEPEQVCLREFDSDLSLDNEFRVFICEDRITAISQYDHYAHYPGLEDKVSFLATGIEKLWKEVHNKIGVSSYVMDVGYLPRSEKFVVIEFSPFFPCTGAALFSWSKDEDTLLGRKPFEFRIKTSTEVHPQLDELIQCNWEDRWRTPIPRYDSLFLPGSSISTEWSGTIRRLLAQVPAYVGHFVPLSFSFENIFQKNASVVNSISSISTFVASIGTWAFHYTSLIGLRGKLYNDQGHLLFVYGTLKRGFHWSDKYLHRRGEGRVNNFISRAVTRDMHRLVVGKCGVPYLSLGVAQDGVFGSSGNRVRGELWCVSSECLQNLDDYEGISKDYYSRKSIFVCTEGKEEPVEAQVYCINFIPSELSSEPFIEEYTLDMHKELYNPIQHIQVKQLSYIQAPSSWGKVRFPSVVGMNNSMT
mmetsp:Transcript_16301/g.24567  ORF Transcript_16301/g.24567 Transcript_16301/m.24567 type:complete len:588 (-) Transcript_16301:62-1825(-)